MPIFAHVPMILGSDGKKLSKRHGATAVGDYQDQGILPAAMRNFLALLGWSPGGDREIMTEAEMIELFSLEGIQKKAAVFDIDQAGVDERPVPLGRCRPRTCWLPVRQLLSERASRRCKRLRTLIDAVKARSRTLLDVAGQVAMRLPIAMSGRGVVLDPKGVALKEKLGAAFSANLRLAHSALSALTTRLDPAESRGELKALAEKEGKKLGDIMQPIRVALTGGTVSEPVNELLAVVGREESLARIDAAAS